MDYIRAIRLVALKNVLHDATEDAIWRRIARFYSKEFNTPLHEVDNLPRLDVIQAYYESNYENMDDSHIQEELHNLLAPQDALQNALSKSKDDVIMETLAKETERSSKIPKNINPIKKEENKKLDKIEMSQEMLDALDGLGMAISDIKKEIETPKEFDIDFGLDK